MKIKVMKDPTGDWIAFDEDNVDGDVTWNEGVACFTDATLVGRGANDVDALRNWIEVYDEWQELEGRFCPGAD